MTSDVESQKPSSHTLLQTLTCFIIGGLLVTVVILFDNKLPTGLTIQDEVQHPQSFIAERARKNLLKLTSNGSRIVGSFENEIGAINFLNEEIAKLSNVGNKSMEVDFQIVSGSYYIDFKPFGTYNIYRNVQNVIVKVFAHEPTNNSILLNSHFDSVPTSPGGSDDGIMVVVMLEVLRKLLQSDVKFQHNVIFLFNGAEETPLEAAHGFITQHKWAKEVKIVINLEAAGSGGKEILFQSGPGNSWLVNYYAKVPHPHGQVAGEEIFQTNLIPSDTDFRVFRDYGNAVGFDLAFYKNGYRYHTNHDDVANIPLCSYQHAGDNVLALVKSLANAPEIETRSDGKAVYFDVFGFFMISYKDRTGIIVNVIIVLFSFIVTYKSFLDFKLGRSWKSKIYIIVTAFAILLGWGVATVGVLIIAMFIDILSYSMSWYAHPYFVVGLYAIPTLMFSCLPLIVWNKMNKKIHFSTRVQSQLQSSIVRLIWTVILLISTCLRIRTSYAIMITVLFSTIGTTLIHLMRLHHSANGWKVLHLLLNIFPSMMVLYQTIMSLSLFIPITGRIGSDKNPELIVGIITMILTILFSSYYVHFITTMRKPFWLLYCFLVIFLVNVLLMLTPFGFPYSSNPDAPAQQRFMIYHTKRTINDAKGVAVRDAGYFLLNLDRNSPDSVRPYVRQFEKSVSLQEDCQRFLICGLPLSSPRMLTVMESSTWIPAEDPVIDEDIALNLNSKEMVRPNLLSLNFTASGPDHFNIYLSPKRNVRLVGTSFDEKVPENVALWNDRPVYFAIITSGLAKTPVQFTVDLEVPNNFTGSCVDIAISGKYVHDKVNRYTVQFRSFLQDFPSWANIVPAIANFESWEIQF